MNLNVTTLSVLTTAVIAVSGCASSGGLSNLALAESYDRGRYDDIVAVDSTVDTHRDTSLSVRAIEATEAALIAAAQPIVERCLEDEMDRLDARTLRGSFSFEVDVQPSGDVTRADLIGSDVEEPATGRSATEFAPCVGSELLTLSLDPVLEQTYTHTYVGYVGEAW